jgi:hypothetical protein
VAAIRARILQVAIKRGKAAPTGTSGTALASLFYPVKIPTWDEVSTTLAGSRLGGSQVSSKVVAFSSPRSQFLDNFRLADNSGSIQQISQRRFTSSR